MRKMILALGLMAASLLTALPVKAANCTQLSGGMGLCIPKFNTTGDQWGQAMINAFTQINNSTSSVTTSTTGIVFGYLYVSTISGNGANITMSSQTYFSKTGASTYSIVLDSGAYSKAGFTGDFFKATTGFFGPGWALTGMSTATWAGIVPTSKGGTAGDFSGTAQGNIWYFSGTGAVSALAPGSANNVLASGGAGANPAWTGSPTIAGTNFTGTGASFTAGNVTTNANLTGDITSSGSNATTAAATQANIKTMSGLTNISSVLTFTGSSTTFQTAILSSGTLTFLSTYAEAISSIAASGTNLTISWSSSTVYAIVLTGNTAFTFNNQTKGTSMTLLLTQDGTGTRIPTWPTVDWGTAGVPTLSTATGKKDILTLFYDGQQTFGFPVQKGY